MNLKSLYLSELRKSRALVKRIYGGKRTLQELPVALQHFITQSGFVDHHDLHSAEINWKNTFLKFSKTADWRQISCEQYNFLPDPIRLAYMKAKFMGIFNVEALDSFRHGEGHMRIKALGRININDAKGIEMDRSALVTILAETMIIPDYALHSYIQWQELDPYTILGTINYYGLKATGVFYFNHNFEITQFETNDRSLADKHGKLIPTKWTAAASAYITKEGLRFPSSFSATWNQESGDFCYFRGEIATIKLNK